MTYDIAFGGFRLLICITEGIADIDSRRFLGCNVDASQVNVATKSRLRIAKNQVCSALLLVTGTDVGIRTKETLDSTYVWIGRVGQILMRRFPLNVRSDRQ